MDDTSTSTAPAAPSPQVSDGTKTIKFLGFECNEMENFSLCKSPRREECIVILSSFPSTAYIRIVPLDRELNFVSEGEQKVFERKCSDKSHVYRFVPF